MKVGTDGVLLGAWAAGENVRSVIDAGSGSGLISLMMAQRFPAAMIEGIDIDRDACLDATDNVSASPWSDRITIRNADVLEADRGSLPSPLLLISNPPFFNEELHSPEEGRSLARHGEGFGVDSLIHLAGKLLLHHADSLAFIAPASRSGEIEFSLAFSRLDIRRRAQVCSRIGRPPLRTLYQVGKGFTAGSGAEETVIYIRDESNQLTDQYKKLTSEFYLDK